MTWLDRRASFVLASLALLGACGRKVEPAPTASAPTASAAASASAPPPPSGPTPAPANGQPVGSGFAQVVLATDKASGCREEQAIIAEYLMRGELAIAGRAEGDQPQFAVTWLIKLPEHSQIGFAGYGDDAKRIARTRSVGSSREHPPHVYATGDRWTIAWFDDEGLAYARPTWELLPKPTIEHLGAAKAIDPEQIALSGAAGGSLVVASHIGTKGDQLSLFLFSPNAGQPPRAIGMTKFAKSPSVPAVAADDAGYTLAWLEPDGRMVASRIDLQGEEVGTGAVVADPAGKREELHLTRVKGGTLLTWLEGGRILVRKLDEAARPTGDIHVIGSGKHPVLVTAGDDALAAFLTKVGEHEDQLVALRIGADASVSSTAVRFTSGPNPVLDPPAVAVGGTRVAAAWTEVMSKTITTKRASLRLIDASCLK